MPTVFNENQKLLKSSDKLTPTSKNSINVKEVLTRYSEVVKEIKPLQEKGQKLAKNVKSPVKVK